MKNSLGGNSLTSIIWTVSPNLKHLSLTVSTLEFAKRAKNIKNKAKVNELIDDHDIVQNVSFIWINTIKIFCTQKLKKLERHIFNLGKSSMNNSK